MRNRIVGAIWVSSVVLPWALFVAIGIAERQDIDFVSHKCLLLFWCVALVAAFAASFSFRLPLSARIVLPFIVIVAHIVIFFVVCAIIITFFGFEAT